VAPRLDLVALSLLWTEQADRRPRCRLEPPGAEARQGGLGERPDDARHAGSPDLWTLLDLDEAVDRLGVSSPQAVAARLRARAERAMGDADTLGLGLVARGDDGYPPLLERIPAPPPVLWTRGGTQLSGPAVAVVGSRAASPHGLEVGFRLGRDLARAGILVVSGMARGVDAAAHTGALRSGGRTIAVLGCGADVDYPPEHNRLAREIEASGALVSEFAPGVPPRGWHFPRRNRIISGLAIGVVIVEASHRSGSLITARCALEQGRSVMAVPGSVLSGRNRGAHALLRDGAPMVEDAADVIEVLRTDWRMGSDSIQEASAGIESDPELVESGPIPRDPILRKMQAGESYALEDLTAQTALGTAELLSRLARLEVGGQVRRVEGGRFVKGGANVLT